MVCHSFRVGGCWVADQWPLQFLAGFPQHKDTAAHSSAGSRHGCRKSLGPENMHKDVATDLCIVDDEWYCNMSGNSIRLSWSAKWESLSAPGWACESLLLNKSNRSISLFFTKTQWDEEKSCDKCNWDTWLWGCGIWFTQHGVMNLTNPRQNRLIPAIFCITSWATSSDDTQVTERSLLGSEIWMVPICFQKPW